MAVLPRKQSGAVRGPLCLLGSVGTGPVDNVAAF